MNVPLLLVPMMNTLVLISRVKIDNKIVLIDGEQLAKYMIDFDIGVSKVATYNVKKIDTDYFTED